MNEFKGFDATEVEVSGDKDYGLIPPGWYNATIASAELRQTRAGTGSYISLAYRIFGERFENRRVFSNVTFVNPNAVAEQIGRETLARIARAVGVLKIERLEQLVGKGLAIKVRIRPARGEWDESNEVSTVKALAPGVKVPGNIAGSSSSYVPAGAPTKKATSNPWE